MSEPFRITSPLHGDVLNLHDGKETSNQLTVEVAGAAPQGAVHSLGIALGVPTGRPEALAAAPPNLDRSERAGKAEALRPGLCHAPRHCGGGPTNGPA